MILITGCAGYIGRRLALWLQSTGYQVRGLVLPEEVAEVSELVERGMQVWVGNLLDPETLEGIGKGVTQIVHLAGVHATVTKMEQLYVEGTRNLIKACWEAPVKVCLIASNHSVYGSQGNQILTEASALCPDHPFGAITLKMENLVQGLWKESAFPGILLRIAEVYGPQPYNLALSLKQNKLTLLGNGSNYASRIHIDDLVAIFASGLDQLNPGEVYNVCDDLSLPQQQFFVELHERYQLPLPSYIPSETVPERVRLGIHGLRALSLRLSNQKLKQQLGLSLKYPTYREGMRALLELENELAL